MIYRGLPALMTLFAAAISMLVTFLYKYELTKSLIIILVCSFIFYIFGLIIRKVLNVYLVVKEEKENEDTVAEEGEESGEGDATE